MNWSWRSGAIGGATVGALGTAWAHGIYGCPWGSSVIYGILLGVAALAIGGLFDDQ